MSLFSCLFGGLAALGSVLASAAVVAPIVVPGESAYPESLSASVDGTLYIGRAGDGGVVRRQPGHRPEIWIAPGAFGTRSILGVLVDEPSGTLWVCSDDLTSAGIASPGAGKTGLKGFDLRTGRGKVSADVPGEDTYCSDVTVASDGTVYISDGSGRILRLNSDARTFAILVTDPRDCLWRGWQSLRQYVWQWRAVPGGCQRRRRGQAHQTQHITTSDAS
jgi:hypothetical protein